MLRWPPDHRSVLWVAFLAAMLASPAWSAQAAPVEDVGAVTTGCTAPEAQPSRAVEATSKPAAGVDEAELRRLHAALEDIPGFVDVHKVMDEPRFIAYFDSVPPATLPDVGVAYPIEAREVDARATPIADTTAGDPPLIPGPCEGFRPGANVWGCSYAFMFSGSDGATYWSTAGHCVPLPIGADVNGVGTLAFRVDDGIGQDFALVRFYPQIPRDPTVCHWGGPVGTAEGEGGLGKVVRMYGQGMVFGAHDATKPRSGVLFSMGVESFTYVAPVWSGDSGSPVLLENGLALGVHTHGADFGGPLSTPTIKFGTRLQHGVELAEADLGIELTLLTDSA